MAFFLKVVVLLFCVNEVGSTITGGPLPENMKRCFQMRCGGVSPQDMPAFSIQYTCINFHLAYLNVDKDMIRGLTQDNKNWLRSMGRQLGGLILEGEKKRKKRQAPGDDKFRQRREIRTFSQEELDKYFRVVNEMKADGTYDTVSNLHQHTAIPGGHFGPGFSGWHRLFLIVYQLAVWQKDRDVTIPFCDTRLDFNIPKPNDPWGSGLFGQKYFGTGNGIVVNGPFKNWATPASTILQRNVGMGGSFMTDDAFGRIVNATRTKEILVDPSYSNLELHHNSVHVSIGGHMGDLVYSPCDPFFYCHHAFVDYTWQKFREHQQREDINPAFDFPFVNDTYHRYNSKMEMLADYLDMPLVQINGYDNYFNDPSVVRWDDSHYEYPTCGQYPDIEANNETQTCHAKLRSPSEDITVRLLQSMRAPGDKKKFEGKSLFTAFKHDSRIKTRRKRSAMHQRVEMESGENGHLDPMNLITENTFQLDGVIDSSRWAFIPIRVVYERAPDTHFVADTAKYQRVMDEIAEHKPVEKLKRGDDDLYSPRNYRRLSKKLKHGHPATYGKSEYMGSGAYRIFVETVGFSYVGKYIDYAIVDERQPVSEVVAYAAVKRPIGDEVVESYVTAYDPNGRVCQPRCLVCGSDPPRYEPCSGIIKIDNSHPKMYGRNLGDAYLLRYKFQKDGLPLSRDNEIFLMFFCEYENKFPWEECRY